MAFILDALAFQDQGFNEIELATEYLRFENTDQIDSIKLFGFSQLFPSRKKDDYVLDSNPCMPGNDFNKLCKYSVPFSENRVILQ
jgi:hypothetical protein